MLGGGGTDTIDGGDGNDYLAGGTGNDRLFGGDGRDVLNAENDGFKDILDGQVGADEYYLWSGDEGRDSSFDGAADYYYTSSGAIIADADGVWNSTRWWVNPRTEPLPSSALRLAGTAMLAEASASDDLNVTRAGKTIVDDVKDGFATVSLTETGALSVSYSDGKLGALSYNWADGGIRLNVGRESSSTVGTDRADKLHGTNRADLIVAGDGDDVVEGRAGDDEISGEGGNDKLSGGEGNDSLYGDRGDDRLDGGSGNDKLWGGSGNDRLDGGSGNDLLSGNDGDDQLDGGSGNDRLLGGAGIDRMTGGAGADTFVVYAGDGADVVVDFTATRGNSVHDVIEVGSETVGFDTFADIQAHMSQAGANTVIDFGNGDSLTLQNVRMSSLHASDFAFM